MPKKCELCGCTICIGSIIGEHEVCLSCYGSVIQDQNRLHRQGVTLTEEQIVKDRLKAMAL